MTDIVTTLVTAVLLAINAPADTTTIAPAVRLDPPVTTTTTTVPAPTVPPFDGSYVNGTCVGAIPLLEWFSPGWDAQHMARIMYRESRCQPDASNSCCSGLLQMHRMHVPSHGECGVWSRADYYDPVKNVCSAALLWQAQGMGAWSQTR